MQTNGPEIDPIVNRALSSAERRFYVILLVDWNKDGGFSHALSDLSHYADDIRIDRSLAGSAPPELMLIEGAAAAELSFIVSGEASSIAGNPMIFPAVFSPYNGLSPLYGNDPIGAEVLYSLGVETSLGVFWYRQFTGNVRTITPGRGDNTVEITCLDREEFLRQPVQLPPWGKCQLHATRGWQLGQLMPSSWVIDHALRFVDCSATPYRPVTFDERSNPQIGDWRGRPDWGVQFWLTGGGSYAPSIGTVDGVDIQGYPHTEEGSPPISERSGEPHPDVKEEVLEAGLRPYNLTAMGNDDSGLRPEYYPLHPNDNRQRSFFKQYRARNPSTVIPGDCNWFGFTLITNGTNGDWWKSNQTTVMEFYHFYGVKVQLQVNTHSARIRIELPNSSTPVLNSPWIGIPAGQDSVDIEARFVLGDIYTGSPETHAALRINGVDEFLEQNWPQYDGPSIRFEQRGLITVNHKVGFQDMYWCNRWVSVTGPIGSQTGQWVRRDATFAAVLDDGLNKLTHVPQTDYEDAWGMITDVAAAEFGSVFWDERGVFRFWNRETMLAKQANIVQTINLDDVADLKITNTIDSVRNKIVTEAAVGHVIPTVVFESTDPQEFQLLNFAWVEFTLSGQGIVGVTPWPIPLIAEANWNDDIIHGVVIEEEVAPGVWEDIGGAITEDGLPVAFLDDDRNLILYAAGLDQFTPWRIAKIRISGQTLAPNLLPVTEKLSDPESVDKYGVKIYHRQGSWVQSQPDVVKKLNEWTLERTKQPIPTTDGIRVAGDPRRQLGDTLRIADPDGLGEEMKVQILGINRTYSRAEGLSEELTVEMIRPAGIGLWDSEQYGLWDTTFTWSD